MRMTPSKTRLAMIAIILLLTVCAQMLAQERARDRRRYLDPATPVSDDPRRVPVPPGPRGPDGSIVLRGGRVFDGTGAPVRNATVVIQRNRIAKIVPPDSTDWPRDARVVDVSGKTVMPGLIDLHTHITYDEPNVPVALSVSPSDATLRALERLRYYLESGITSI